MPRFVALPFTLLVLLCAGCSQNEEPAPQATVEPASAPVPVTTESTPEEVPELDWDALIPAGWNPETLMGEYDAENLEDDDPRAQELMDKLKALWAQAPVVKELDGNRVKLPGFVVPLEGEVEKIEEFLLVPYYGACIHVPPPPANQTVHVITEPGKPFTGKLFDTVWVTGTLEVEHLSSELAEAGYRITGARVEPYE